MTCGSTSAPRGNCRPLPALLRPFCIRAPADGERRHWSGPRPTVARGYRGRCDSCSCCLADRPGLRAGRRFSSAERPRPGARFCCLDLWPLAPHRWPGPCCSSEERRRDRRDFVYRNGLAHRPAPGSCWPVPCAVFRLLVSPRRVTRKHLLPCEGPERLRWVFPEEVELHPATCSFGRDIPALPRPWHSR